MHPYSVEIAGDTGIVECVAALDELESFFYAAQRRVRFTFGRADPKPVDRAALGEPKTQPIDAGWVSI
jgi:hypothetical protein